MFVAHAPSGYLLYQAIRKNSKLRGLSERSILISSVLGSIAPDFDFLYYFTLGVKGVSHRTYITHMPYFWVSLMILFLAWSWANKKSKLAQLGIIFQIGALLHLALDSLMSGICWLAPFDMTRYALFDTPERTKPFLTHYIEHGPFYYEVFIILAALLVFCWNHRKQLRSSESENQAPDLIP